MWLLVAIRFVGVEVHCTYSNGVGWLRIIVEGSCPLYL